MPLLFLYNRSMKKLGIVYSADVSGVEDNIAHLLEHCITAQLYERLRCNDLDLFDCYSTTTPDNIIFDITAYNGAVAGIVSEIMSSLEPISIDQICAEIHRIELEDDLPLYANNVEKVRGTINELISHTRFDTVDNVDDIPKPHEDLAKPSNRLLVYGLGAREWVLSICFNCTTDDTRMCIINCLAGRFLRCKDIYALRNEVDSDKINYIFRTSKSTSQSDLDERWQNVFNDFVANDLDQILSSLDVSSGSAVVYKETVRSLKALISPN